MQVTTIDRFAPEPGELVTWAVDTEGRVPVASPVPPSFNQSVHLGGAEGATVWLAAAFDIDGPVDLKAAEYAYRALIARHGTLHSSFTRHGGEIVREVFDPDDLTLVERPPLRLDSGAALRQRLWSDFDAACGPFGFPAYLPAAISRPDRSTLICAFDHSHVDAWSISIIIDDLHSLYHGFLAEPGGFDADHLPMSGNFLDFCAAETLRPPTGPGDPRLREWVRFLDARDGTPPSFPLDLGVAPGESAPQGADVRPVLDAGATALFEAHCRRNGASLFAGVLSAMAGATRAMGGGPELALLFPMHTRHDEPARRAVGWFTTNAPLSVVAGLDLTETMRRTGPALRAAVRLGEIPIPEVVGAIGGLRQERSDVFMVSYVDYRALPGAGRHDAVRAHHVSNVTTADDAQFWLSRTESGLAIRSRFPDTATGRSVISDFLSEVIDAVARVPSEVRCR
ncbi:condensation domain-containing protein [Gordonia soli]|uniref:Condensation domain-containing protein n=1 Tax=Gordonia soli NBRC 108243 TaxID=1223545 RepID=M0QNB0_9ACTN|nr:condensation domain-containing protein [Gordonia soli]GAC69776.1 hypothetical protein GS4_28_00240 [Gordonia soli NBRC 108243]